MSPAYTMDPAEEDEEAEEVIDYTFLGISVCQTVEERVQAKREKSKQTARRIVTGVFRLPSCCFSPQTLEDDDPRVATLPFLIHCFENTSNAIVNELVICYCRRGIRATYHYIC